MNAVIELEAAYEHYKNDPEFNRELTELFNEYAGRPSRLYYAEKMTKDLGGAKIYLKREDLNHTGAHKINNVLGQALLAKKMGKARLIAETYIIPGNKHTPERESCYFHLVGGPEAEKKNGVPKWNVREAYSKYPNSETELAEFLKSLQKGK